MARRDADLAEKCDVVCRMGSLMLASGTGSYRVKAAMGRVAQAMGIEQLDAQVSLNELVVTTRMAGSFRTQVVEVPVLVVNADRIGALMRVSLRATRGVSVDELNRQLDLVEARPALYRPWFVAGAAGLACMSFAFLNNGRWQECVAAAVAAIAGKSLQLALRRLRLNPLAGIALVSVLACLSYVLLSRLLQLISSSIEPVDAAAFTSAILFLIPGFPLMTAALDLARFDFTSGLSRIAHASMVTVAAALGAWVVAQGFGLRPSTIPTIELGAMVMLGLRVAASFLGVVGFALTFNTPVRVGLWAGAFGAISNVGRLAATDAGVSPVLSAVVATTAIGLMAGWAGQRILAPRISLSVPAVLIMVPGASTYRALVETYGQDPLSALANGTSSMIMLLALATGLVIARMVTDPGWTQPTPVWTKMPPTRAQQRLRAGRPDLENTDDS